MKRVTQQSIKEQDIDIVMIEKKLHNISDAIKNCNKKNLTDVNVVCEEIFGEILNRIYDLNLISASAEIGGNFIAVDLIDYEKKIAYQVTSQYKQEKIKKTIQKFNNSGLYKKLNELNLLILSSKGHEYRRQEDEKLENGNVFSYEKNIIDFNKLISEIRIKSKSNRALITQIYDCINMVYDSGRLKTLSIVKHTNLLKQKKSFDSGEWRVWEMGYGDVCLSALIPLSYKKELCCILRFRQNDLSGVIMNFSQETLFDRYFVLEKEFEEKHNVARYEDEDIMFMRVENIRISINGFTAYHVYQLFKELKDAYIMAKQKIDTVLGTRRK